LHAEAKIALSRRSILDPVVRAPMICFSADWETHRGGVPPTGASAQLSEPVTERSQ